MVSWIEVRKANIGNGLFATKDFKRGELVVRFRGPLLSLEADDRVDKRTRDNSIRFGPSTFLSPAGTVEEYVNHSCSPNCYIAKINQRLCLVALTSIKQGEELTFDYSTILAKDDIWTMRCLCQEPSCRRTVKHFYSLPKEIQEFYISKRAVPSYILKIK